MPDHALRCMPGQTCACRWVFAARDLAAAAPDTSPRSIKSFCPARVFRISSSAGGWYVVTEAAPWLQEAVSVFGEECRRKLAGPGDREAAIRTPLETLLRTVGARIGVPAVFHDEVRDADRRVRPDYGVSVAGAINGYIEVKAPRRALDPASFTGHDQQQWERLRDLPNLIYTNGIVWRLYQDGE